MRLLAGLVVAFGLLGLSCGSSSSGPPVGSTNDGGSDAMGYEGPDAGGSGDAGEAGAGSGGLTGAVSATNERYGTVRSYFAGASFQTGPGPCTLSKSGACTTLDCPPFDGGAPTSANAGTVTITGGAVPLSLSYGSNSYAAVGSSTNALWSGGETISIHAAGAAVPAFSGTLVAPAAVTLQSPTLPSTGSLSLPRSADFVLRWSGQTAGSVAVTLEVAHRSLVCTFDATAGTGTVGAQQLAFLPAGQGILTVYGDSGTHVTAGQWDVRLDLYTDATTPDGRRAASSITTQ